MPAERRQCMCSKCHGKDVGLTTWYKHNPEERKRRRRARARAKDDLRSTYEGSPDHRDRPLNRESDIYVKEESVPPDRVGMTSRSDTVSGNLICLSCMHRIYA